MIRTFRDLEVWQRGMDLAQRAYRFAAMLPVDERYGLISQIRRCAVSVPANIAEGHARDSTREYLRFVSISLGSLAELDTLLELACTLHGLQRPDAAEEIEQLRLKLRALQGSLKARLPAPSSPLPAP